MMLDIKEFLKPSVLGYYKRCEVTQISFYKGNHEDESNLLTLFVFDEENFQGRNEIFLTGNKNKITSKYKLCIKRFYLSIEESIELFNCLNQGVSKTSSLKEYIFNNNPLKLLPQQFITTNKDIRFNKILKNNFNSGSYIFEFFDEEKDFELLFGLNKSGRLKKISKMIGEVVPIDLLSCTDCLGNYIFQLPITILNVHTKKNKNILGIDFYWHNNLINEVKPNCLINIYSKVDNNYLFDIFEEYNKENHQKINILPSGKNYVIKIWNNDLKILLYEMNSRYFEKFRVSVSMGECERKFIEDNEESEVTIMSNPKLSDDISYLNYRNDAMYKKNLKELEDNLKFNTYMQNENALEDIKTLINKYGKNGVNIIDPYLEPNDLIRTVLHLKFYDAPIKAITSLKNSFNELLIMKEMLEQLPNQNIVQNFKNVLNEKIEKEKKSNLECIEDYKKELDEKIINQCGLNLEFRAQFDRYGQPFHDRFLIFPGDDEKLLEPIVFSLGTSLNAFGKHFHILQEVSHPQHVADVFDKLWRILQQKEECRIWNSKE